MTPLEKALQRAGDSPKLAQLLLDVVSQFITPKEDPVYDWQIVPITRVCGAKVANGHTWQADLPEEIKTAAWTAPAKQCAIAWGTRLAPSRFHDEDAQPTPVAVLVHAVQDEQGNIRAEVGASFLYSQNTGWFPARNTNLDPLLRSLIVGYLNKQRQQSASSAEVDPAQGVDLE